MESEIQNPHLDKQAIFPPINSCMLSSKIIGQMGGFSKLFRYILFRKNFLTNWKTAPGT